MTRNPLTVTEKNSVMILKVEQIGADGLVTLLEPRAAEVMDVREA